MKETNLTLSYKLVTFLVFTFFCLSFNLQAEKIALFYHPNYVHIEENNLFAEASNLKITLENQGHEIFLFQGLEDEDIIEAISIGSLIIIPELEKANLIEDLSKSTQDALRNYIAWGGGLIINGVVSSISQNNDNAIKLLNSVFDYDLEIGTTELSGSAFLNEEQAIETNFLGGPGIISDNSANAYLKLNSLPTGALSIYSKNDDASEVSVALLPYGKGKICYLGWSWWNASPVGDLDGGWIEVIERAIVELACPADIEMGTTELRLKLDETGVIDIKSTDLGVIHLSCGEIDELIFTPNRFTCNNIGDNTILVTLKDKMGRMASKTIHLTLTDDEGVCAQIPQSISLSGTIHTESGTTVSGVQLDIKETNIDRQVSDEKGHFYFENLAYGQDYTIEPTKDDNHLNGVSTYDLNLIRRHILGISPLDSPYKMIAADINRSGSITALDLVELQRLILNIDKSYTNNDSWRFVDASHEFVDPSNPFVTAFPENYQMSLLPAASSIDFIGVKIGDINHSAITNPLWSSSTRSTSSLTISASDRFVKKGEIVEVDFRVEDWQAVLGYQFTMEFDPSLLNFIEVVENMDGVMKVSNFGFSQVEEGLLTASWDDLKPITDKNALLFRLRFVAKTNTKLSKSLKLSSQLTSIEAFDINNNFFDLALRFESSIIETGETKLMQNYPNPFRDKTTIPFILSEDGRVNITIYDLSGRILKAYQADLTRGKHTIELERRAFTATSTLIYRLETSGFSATRKMLLIE